MSNDFMELNDMELNYIYFGNETGSDDTSKNTKCVVFCFFFDWNLGSL